MDTTQLEKVRSGAGFFAALDQSGGSTPKALADYGIDRSRYRSDEQMFDLVHAMRTRVIASPAFDGSLVLAAILFEQTMQRDMHGVPTARYLWDTKRVVPFLKVDKDLADERQGVRLMKPIDTLDELLEQANRHHIFGTKMRSVINDADKDGINSIVEQQFDYGARISAAGLVPILEPEVSIDSPNKDDAESLLGDALLVHVQALPNDARILLKLTIPTQLGRYAALAADRRGLRVLALSGGYSRDQACALLAQDPDMIASFSPALLEGLSDQQTDEQFDAQLDASIAQIFQASVAKTPAGGDPTRSPFHIAVAQGVDPVHDGGRRMPRREMLVTVGSAEESDSVAGAGLAGPGAGVVPRPVLFERLRTSARVTVVSAPAGSGKTILLRSWISEARLAEHAAWVPAGRDERDPQRFWLSLVAALRGTGPGAGLVRAVSAAPDLDGWALAERLLSDLAPLDERLWLVVDDAHETGPEALRQLELLIMRAPPQLRFVLAARHDLRLGLHRLRLEGELTEIRAEDLKFSLAEAGELFTKAEVELPAAALAALYERTEGWAAGLRLAALSLAAHPDPERFAAEFSGTERTAADYLLAEVLERQPEPVRRLMLRTSILERVNGELADLLTGDSGRERVLQDLEQANAFVVSLDAARSWFRYHQMFADLLRLELRRTAPGEVTALHRVAAGWFAGHGYPVQATRHAQAAGDWGMAAELLVGHWPGLYLDGHGGAVHELLAGFPAGLAAADADLAAATAADELARGSLEVAEWYLDLAQRASQSVPAARRGRLRLLLGLVGLLLARQRGNLDAVTDAAERLEAIAESSSIDAAQPNLGQDLRALALISLGSIELWASRFDQSERHLELGVALAHRIGRPYLEFTGLAYQAATDILRSFARAAERGKRAVELARLHGWTDEPAAGITYLILGAVLAWKMRPDEAEQWIQRAERVLSTEAEPATVLGIRYVRGMIEQARGRDAEALAAFRAAEPLAGQLATPHLLAPRARAHEVHTLLRLGQSERAEQVLAGLDVQDRQNGDIRIAAAALRLVQGDPHAAVTELAPLLDGPPPVVMGFRMVTAYTLEAAARDALGDQAASDTALERALDLAEPDGVLHPFLLHPAPGLFERHARHRTAHASLIAEIRGLLAGDRPASAPAPRPPLEPLSDSELRVLRYLPTNLTEPEIARELYVSHNTVKTHIRNLYAKLGAHRRAQAVDHARALGMLAPSHTRPVAHRHSP